MALRETFKFQGLGGGYEAPLLMKALGGQRHEIFRVHDFQWESMGSGNGAVKKKNPKLLTVACDRR